MAVDPVFAARQRAIGTQLTLAQEQYLRTLAQRRRAFIHQISAKSPLAPPKPTHHGLLGSILHSVTDPVALAATQIGEDLAHIPGGMIDLGVNLTKDEIRLLHGRNPKYLPPMGKAYVQGIYEHVTHPTQNPGHLIMDFLPFASGAKGLLTRTTRGVTARSRALKGLPQIKAEEPHTIARHPLIKGYDDLKGEAKTNKAKAILAAQHEQVFESFPFVRPTPPRVRDVLIGKTGRVGKMFFPKKTAEAERAAPERALPIQINQEFHPNTLGQVAVSGRIRKTQFGLIRRPADWFQEGLLPKGAKGHIFTIETRPADYAQWEPMRYKPTDEEIAKATAEGVPAREIINQGAPLLLPVKGTDFEAAFRIFEDTVHEWTKGKSKFDLSIVRSSSSRSAAKKLGLIQSGGLEKEATAALAKALGQKGEKLTEENMPPELKGMGVPEMEALYTPDEIAYLFQKQRERKALAEAPAGSKVKQQLTKTVALHRGFRELKTSKEKAEASLDLAPFIANKKALTPQAAATVLGIRTKAAAEIIDLAKGHVRNAVKAGKYKELRAKLDEAHRARVRAKRGTYKTLAEAAAAVKVEEVPQKLKLVRKELPTEEVTAEERAAAQGLPELPPEHLTPAEKGYIFWERDFRNAPLKTKDFRDLRDEGIEKFGLSKADLAAIYKKPREPGIVAASAAKAAAEKPPSVLKTEAEMSKAVEEAKAQRVEERGGAVAKKPGPKPASASAAELASKLEPPKRAAPEEAAKPAAEAKKPAPSAELKPEKPVPKAKKPKQKIELKIELEDGTVYTKVVDKLPQHWGSVIQREVPHGKSLLGSKRSKRVLPTAEKVAPAKAAPEEAKPLTEEERTAITKKVTELPEAGRLTNLTNQQMGSGYTAWEQDFAEMAKKVPVGAKDVPVKFSDLIQEGKDAFKLKKKEIDILHQKAHEAAPTVKEVTGGKMGAKGSRLQRAGNALRFAKREGDPAKIAAAEKEFADARAESEAVKSALKGKPLSLKKEPAQEPEQVVKPVTDQIKKEMKQHEEKELREGMRKQGMGERDLGTNPRILGKYVPADKLGPLKTALNRSLRGGKSKSDQLQLFKTHLGDKEGAKAYKAWQEDPKIKPPPEDPGVSRIKGGSGTEPMPKTNYEAMIIGIKAFFAPALRERMLIAPMEHTKELPLHRKVYGFEQNITGHYAYPLSTASSIKALQRMTINTARAFAGELGDTRLARIGKKVMLDKKAARYLAHKRKQTLERNEIIINAVNIAERASAFKTDELRQQFIEDEVARLTNEADEGKLRQNLDTINMLASMGVLYLKGPAFYIPNIAGQTTVFASEALWNPITATKALHLMSQVQKRSPTAMGMMMAGVGHGVASLVRKEGGRRGLLGDIVRGAHGKLATTYAEGFKFRGRRVTPGVDLQLRAGSVGLEFMRQGFKTPEEVMALVSNPYRRGRLIDILDRANENAISFNKMGRNQREFLTRFIFFYPWIHGATRYTVRFMFHHPAQTLAYIGGSRYAAAEQQRLLPPLPSFLKGIIRGPNITIPGTNINLGEENVPGIGKVPRFFNPQAAATLGTAGDVLTALSANLLSGKVEGTAQLSQFLNPAASIGMEAFLTRQDPLTGRKFPPGMTALDIIKQETGQLLAPVRFLPGLGQDWRKAEAYRKGEPTEGILMPRGRFDVAGRFLTGFGPTPLNKAESTSRAFAERSGLLNKQQRVYAKSTRDRETWVKAMVEVGMLKPGQKLPKPVRDAFTDRAQRDANQAAFEVANGGPLDTLGRFRADLSLAVRRGLIPADAATNLLKNMTENASDATVEKFYRKFREAFFGVDVISRFKSAINQVRDARGLERITVP